MKGNKIDQHLLVGLYFFMTQMQLSLDRTEWTEFANYANNNFDMESLLSKLKEHFFYYESQPNNPVKPEIGFIREWLAGKLFLYEVEQNYIYSCVERLVNYVQLTEKPDLDSIGNLRLNLAYAAGILEPRAFKKRAEIPLVQHHNQNEIFIDKAKSIPELLGRAWP